VGQHRRTKASAYCRLSPPNRQHLEVESEGAANGVRGGVGHALGSYEPRLPPAEQAAISLVGNHGSMNLIGCSSYVSQKSVHNTNTGKRALFQPDGTYRLVSEAERTGVYTGVQGGMPRGGINMSKRAATAMTAAPAPHQHTPNLSGQPQILPALLGEKLLTLQEQLLRVQDKLDTSLQSCIVSESG